MSTEILRIIAAGSGGVLLGAALSAWVNRRIWRKNRELRAALLEGREPKRTETTKVIIWVCLAMGIAWVWCSYILAWLGKEQIAESLSQVACTEIIGVVLAYCIKSALENLSKNNHWPDKPAETEEEHD